VTLFPGTEFPGRFYCGCGLQLRQHRWQCWLKRLMAVSPSFWKVSSSCCRWCDPARTSSRYPSPPPPPPSVYSLKKPSYICGWSFVLNVSFQTVCEYKAAARALSPATAVHGLCWSGGRHVFPCQALEILPDLWTSTVHLHYY
jgi:hypothetical protein